ncbi:Putative hydro-lyase Teth514_1597 [Geodia barretti]|uniref:Hydro-lyase Teth514_1597 n=1 Tax=Geodia barretti TaxID=519541 RepID=A0AA35X8T1_GEOBA|nr:Putative hydro-lyase Teth514_1597 [Geodia barretti]
MTVQSFASTAEEARHRIRTNQWRGVTSGVAPGHVQANLAILPRDLAFDFLLFCQRNPKPCPLLEVDTLEDYWQDDLVSFLLGCSFSFEQAMIDAGIPLRHQEQGKNVAMYITNVATAPAGVFSGPMVVSMRPIKRDQVVRAVQVTSRFPATHGAPVHIGSPRDIGIRDLDLPDFGEMVEIKPDEEPVFWACGVTPQAVALSCKPPLMFTHAPGRMFITDHRDADYAVL